MMRPRILDGSNYSHWKVKVKACIKSFDARVWRAILYGLSPLNTSDKDCDTMVTPEVDWFTNDVVISRFNS